MAYCQCRLRKVFGAVFKQFNWSDVSIVIDGSHLHSHVLGTTLNEGLQKGKIYPNVIMYRSKVKEDFEEYLRAASEKSRGSNG